MSDKRKRYILPEEEIPHYWYNIQADMVNKPMPPLHPGTKQPLKAEDLYPIFAKELCHQELNQTDAWIEIPEDVREMYKCYRSTPLVRAYGLEKALGTPAHIYFKNESVSPIGSHKLNSALAQAYYCKEEGVTNVTTETGAGQWGAALSYAAKVFGLEAAVYQVKISYEQKPYRRSIMQTFGAQVTPSPSMSTRAGKDILTAHPTYQGSLGTAISEAIPAQAGQRKGGTHGDGGGCQIFSDRRGPVVRRAGGGTGYVQRKCGKLYKYLFTIRVKRSIIST